MSRKIIILVFKDGGDFEMFDVLLLAEKIKKHTPDAEIHCLTNRVSNITPISDLYALNSFIPMEHPEWRGWWSKMNLFSPSLQDYRPFVYIDLDSAVLDNLAFMFDKDLEGRFITLEDFYQPGNLATGVMSIPNSKEMNAIYEKFVGNPQHWMGTYRGDQDFIKAFWKADEFWQHITKKITTFKPKGKGWRKELNKEAIICFHGRPRPKDARSINWVNDYYGL